MYSKYYHIPKQYYKSPYRKPNKHDIINILLILWIIIAVIMLLILSYMLGQLSQKEEKGVHPKSKYKIIRVYTKGSIYARQINEAISYYNDIEPFFAITSDPDSSDVTCYDFQEGMKEEIGTLGVTNDNGRVGFNMHLLQGKPDSIIISVAMHEMGHVIGLQHNNEKDSIMNSKYNPTKFTKKDIERIEEQWNK